MIPKKIEAHTDFETRTVYLVIRNDRITIDGDISSVVLDIEEAESLRERLHLAAYMGRYRVRP